MLELISLSQAAGGVPHLDDVTIHCVKGRLTTLLGRTGAGKTTLMRVIAGLEQPDRGRVVLDGQDWSRLAPWQRPVAMVTQQFINYPHLSVLDNVAFPLLRRKVPAEAAREAARDMLGRVGLGQMTGRRPGQLSGGQQQRVAIARALVKKAPVLLLDEPFVNLDYKLREGLREELVDLLRTERDTIVVYASTDPREALQMGDTVVLMAEGRALQSGTARAVYDAPATARAAEVVNDPPINLIGMEVTADEIRLERLATLPRERLGRPLAPGRYTLGLRAHALGQGGGIPARVALTEVSGSETVTHLDAGGQALVMLERTVSEHAIGSSIGLSLDLGEALVFDRGGNLIGKEARHG
ncbi:ABC transporter ATP-binding protein [Cereibacter sphaeroides]|uniref:ABC transporter ATP-binding protein n=1 Tax=Cereibacter sphaeroides TaxID=1063 RepID=UPI001F400C9C|nr:ABC transporter ATP-binding protein [Cereibacter sphaeroides]MCE6957702.1 ABC transporter ATP-binding protein [Cereibacter sphaeroides]MCE6967272.1 ABC transporter ATP-binding protein [Cereibacter sphaeroides]MCE6971467.1 ABC transporter ATP-binding protein [Cereibacter sphaeroides]